MTKKNIDKKTFSEFFDPYNKKHIEAYKYLLSNGQWPKYFSDLIATNVKVMGAWDHELKHKIVLAYLKHYKKLIPIKVRSRKSKAVKLQNWICEQISKLTNISYSHEDDALIESRPMGQSGTDVVLRGEAAKLFPWKIEAKKTETFSFKADCKQAREYAEKKKNWLLFHRYDREKAPTVTMDAEIFFKLLEEIDYVNKTS